MQLNKRTLLYTALACAALTGTLVIGIELGRSPQLFEALQQDSDQDPREAILDKVERYAQQQAQTQPSLLDPFAQSALSNVPFMPLDIDRLFDSLDASPSLFNFGGRGLGANFSNTAPAKIDVEEEKDEYRVVISLTEGSDIQLKTDLENNTLSISAQVRTEVKQHDGGRQLSSTSMSQISRAIPFNSPVDATGMQTEKSDSAVVIRIPKLS